MVKATTWGNSLKPILLLTLLVAGFLTLLYPTSNNHWESHQTTLINTVSSVSPAFQSSTTFSSKLAEYCIDQLGSLETASNIQQYVPSTKGQRKALLILRNQEITSYNRLFIVEGDGLIDPDGRLSKGFETGEIYNAASWLGSRGAISLGMATPEVYQNAGYGGEIPKSAYAFEGNMNLFGGKYIDAWTASYNPAFIALQNGYECFSGTGLHYYNLNQNLSITERLRSGSQSLAGGFTTALLTTQFQGEAPASNEPLEVGGALREPGNIPPKLYHYTLDQYADGIDKEGLRPDRGLSGKIFTTPNGNLTPTQAQIDLGLKPNRGLPKALFEIDAAALQKNGINPTFGPVRVQPTGTSPGGGEEIIYEKEIKPKYLKQMR